MRKVARFWRNVRGITARLRPSRAFVHERSSVVAIIVALMLVPLVIAAGGALDLARLYLAKTRLIYALDTAALAAGSTYDVNDTTAAQNAFDNYFNANYDAVKRTKATITPYPPVPTITSGQVTVSARVTVNTVFLKLISINTLSASVTSTVDRETTGLELALVLDNSSSMTTGTRLADLKSAVGTLLDTVFGGPDPSRIRVGIVPYAGAVNIGTNNSSFAQADPGNEYPVDDGLNAADPIVDTAWKGCVLARPSPYDTTDDYSPGSSTDGEWPRYFWESSNYYVANGTPLVDPVTGAGNGEPARDPVTGALSAKACSNRWWRPLDGLLHSLPRESGLNSDPSFYASGVNQGSFRDPDPTPGTPGAALTDVSSPDTTGPNKSCPTPITPLTNVRADLNTAVTNMQAWATGGTLIGQGAVWGWRLLSPTAPFTTHEDGSAIAAYTDKTVNKAIVIMTDGENAIDTQNQQCYYAFNPDGNPRYNSQYTAYGFLSDGKLGTTTNINSAEAELDTRTLAVCSNIKAQGITIYTILLGIDSSNPAYGNIVNLMTNCASSPSYFFDAPTSSDLSTAFAAIGAQLLKLRVAH